MKRTRNLVGVLLLAGLALASAGMLRAEVAADTAGDMTYVIIVGIIEDLDPIPQIIWQPLVGGDIDKVLNPDGASRGDGPPDFGYDTATVRPLAVWAYNNGSDHDIAIARWNGTAWDPTEFLTSSTVDEVDPRVFVEPDGSLHVVWWVVDTPARSFRTTLPAGSQVWTPAEEIVVPGGAARRPSVAVTGTELIVAVERDASPDQEVAVAVRTGPGVFDSRFTASTTRTERLDPLLHNEQGRVWVDWKHSDTEFAYSELIEGVWSAPQYVAWTGPGWVGEEQARHVIRSAVLAD